MVAFPNTKILIVPDLGKSAEDKAIIALKRSIDEKYGFTAKIVNLHRTVIHEIPEEKIDIVKDPEIIDLLYHLTMSMTGRPSPPCVIGWRRHA